ncbi:MAG: nucleotide exchange factor GrpE [Clostridiales bacterium]|jgi:molecular chaperone GrpE|nr:nucleotide exchange factor GrpE [Clostridiales bacterium]
MDKDKGKGKSKNVDKHKDSGLRLLDDLPMEELGIVGTITPPSEVPVELILGKLKQIAADYENFRVRSEREKAHMFDLGKMQMIEALLPVVDNFALATKNVDPTDSFVKGVLMIQSQFNAIFAEMGVVKIPAMGQKFNPNLHSAVSHIKDKNYGELEIVEELQTGYIYKDVIIRHSVVVVAN